MLWSAWGRDWTADATVASVLATVRRDLRGGGTVLPHDSDLTAAPGCWRSTLGALPGLVGGGREAGWTVGRLAGHMMGEDQPGPFGSRDPYPERTGSFAAAPVGRLPGAGTGER